MTRETRNVNGVWHGIYNYPDGVPLGAFEAELCELDGIVSGNTREKGQGPEDFDLIVTASIEGQISNEHISFVKFYDSPLPYYLPVQYDGSISPEGDEIAGKWTIPGEWSGTFIMVRKSSMETLSKIEAKESVA